MPTMMFFFLVTDGDENSAAPEVKPITRSKLLMVSSLSHSLLFLPLSADILILFCDFLCLFSRSNSASSLLTA